MGMGLKNRVRQFWQSLAIKNKLLVFTGLVFLMIFLSVFFNIWVARFSLIDFREILEENARSEEAVNALASESKFFEQYMRGYTDVSEEELTKAIRRTEEAVNALSFDYRLLGDERYAQTWSIYNSYGVYREARDEILELKRRGAENIGLLYDVYEMQEYLQQYAGNLLIETLDAGNILYQKRIPSIMRVPFIIIAAGLFLFGVMLKLVEILNRDIVLPVLQLVEASKKIAANDFQTEDVKVENKDEIGELAAAFNKMKYATQEYILMLEEKRETLALLHQEEMGRLEMEKQLEAMQLDLLKSQINPHFLFNTLNVIGGMANLESAETTEKMIMALSSLFRYNLKTSEREVILDWELMVVRDYIYLQQMRFGSRVECSVDCLADRMRAVVPAFTFQPLVENAVIHGLSPKEEGGRVLIRVWRDTERLYITVTDTGVGMTEEELAALKERLNDKRDGRRGIGIGNIYRRIYAMYQNGQMDIYSRKNVGTIVQIIIPYLEI
ncbi:MAG: histidine kinase [Blautia sp.]|nr:histidine kinase [Blautia sp.]MCM1201241.1 histidine kinase [Bacteroides fragilis]